MPSWESKTAKSAVIPTPQLGASGSRETGTVRERGIPFMSAQAIVTPATPRAARSAASASSDALDAPAPVPSVPTATSSHRADRSGG